MDHLINLLVDDVQPSALMCMTLRTLSDQSVFSEVQAPPGERIYCSRHPIQVPLNDRIASYISAGGNNTVISCFAFNEKQDFVNTFKEHALQYPHELYDIVFEFDVL